MGWLGLCLAFLFWLFMDIVPVHIVDGKEIRSRFYTHIIASGQHIETKNINYAYATEYGFIHGIETDSFHFVYTDTSCLICSRLGVVYDIGVPFAFTERNFGDGTLTLVIDNTGKVYDLHGRPVLPGYKPIKVDHTMPDPYP